MSRIFSLISAKNLGLTYYHNLLIESGFDSTLNINICVRFPSTADSAHCERVYIDAIFDIDYEAGFEDSSNLYRNLLNVNHHVTLFVWTVSFSDAVLAHRILTVITNREDILVDNDIGLVLKGPEFIASFDNMESEGSVSK